MTRVVSIAIADLDDALVIVDALRRVYLGASRDGSYLHVIRPARSTDLRVVEGRAAVGDLICDCIGSSTHGRCYRQIEAVAWEKADHAGLRRPDWLGPPPDPRAELEAGSATFDAPVGAGEAVEASRG